MKKIINIIAAFIISASAYAQDTAFNGIVTDVVGAPLKKVKVYVTDSQTYTFTNKKGEFGLTNINVSDTLKLIYKKNIYYIPLDGRKSIRVRLGDKLEAFDAPDLFNAGMDFISRREFTNSASRISGDLLRQEGYTNVMNALRGKVPGLNINNSTGFGSQGGEFSMRGVSSINASRPPLLLVDGVEVTSFDNISVTDVDYIEVIKDANSYGIRGASGVIKVFTIKPGSR